MLQIKSFQQKMEILYNIVLTIKARKGERGNLQLRHLSSEVTATHDEA